jgi:hypothetical protein
MRCLADPWDIRRPIAGAELALLPKAGSQAQLGLPVSNLFLPRLQSISGKFSEHIDKPG